MTSDDVPDADAREQADLDEDAEDIAEVIVEDGPVPEADALEQAQLVEEEQARDLRPPRGEVSEADWLDQSMVEPIDEDER